MKDNVQQLAGMELASQSTKDVVGEESVILIKSKNKMGIDDGLRHTHFEGLLLPDTLIK